MLGIPDSGVWAAYLFCILSAVVCIIYGIFNWNKGGEDENARIAAKQKWEMSERQVKPKL
jgi:hypothetical protein